MTSQRLPRVAVIGCGAIAYFALVPALSRMGWAPSVLIDTSPRRLDLLAKRVGRKVIKASDWQSVADSFDVAVVAVPHLFHGPIGSALLSAGKHVFMEKPLAITARECEEMSAIADGKGVALSVGLLRRYLSVARWTKALVSSGTLGEVTRFEAREGAVSTTDPGSDAILRLDMSGGGVLMDTGPHTLDLILWWLGDVDSVTYADDSEGGVEADCTIDCRLVSSATGRIVLSRTRNLSNSIRIEGTKGFVEVHLYKNEIIGGSANALAFVHEGIGASTMKPQFAANLFDAELTDFRTSVTTGRHVGVSGRDGTKSVALIEKCYLARAFLPSPWATTSADMTYGRTVGFPRRSRVLVTGASGFIGGRLVERLLNEHSAEVRCIFRNAGSATRVARLPVEMIRADLAHPDDIAKAVSGVDYVFHCAYDTRSRKQNTNGVRNLLDACASSSVKRLVHVSTFSVYEPFPDGLLTEKTRDGDRSMIYVDTKLDLEKNVLEMARARGVPATIVQPSIVYGPFCRPWTNNPAEMLVYGDVILPDQGEGLCNAVYIDDLIDGMILSAVVPAAIGERFILSGPEPVTWGTFFMEFARALGTRPPQFWPHEKIVKQNQGVVRNIRLALSDPKRLIKMIVSWNPARGVLQAGLDAMPAPLKAMVMNYYFGSGRPRGGEVFLPTKQALALYSSKAVARCEKARALLGYSPRFDFGSGMVPTGEYLRWAYGDAKQSMASNSGQSPPAEKDMIGNVGLAKAN
jgi:predicted dehydrogenase/nucleoside-diphosphate-sugar epimerase